MPRKSRTQITKEMARRIAKKLNAQIDKAGSAHDLASVFHDGLIIAQFGIRRGSRGNAGHDHIPSDIFVGPNFTRQLAQCTKSRDQWIQKLIEDGIIDGDVI